MAAPVPLDPEDAKDRAKTVTKKRLNDDKAEYFIEWENDEKEASWEDREKLIRKPSARPLVNQFENELLEQVKKSVEEKINSERRMPLTDLAKFMIDEYPTFQMSVHKVRNMTVFLRSRMRDTVKIADGCAVSAAEEAKLREQEQSAKKNELLDAYIRLIECVKSLGNTKLARVGIMFNSRNPGFKARNFGFRKFKDFVDSCPGIWTDPNYKPGGRLAVEVRDDRPPELADRMKELESRGGGSRGGRDRGGGGGYDRGRGRDVGFRGGGGGGGFDRRGGGGDRRVPPRDRGGGGRDRSRSRGRKKRSRSRDRRKRSRSRSRKRKRSRSRSKKKKRSRSRSRKRSRSGSRSKKESKAPLPHPWEEVIDPKTKKWYYWNPDSDETTWDRPTK